MVNRSMKTCRMNDGAPCAEEPYELAVGQATTLPPPPGMVYVPASEFIMGSSDAEVDYALQLRRALW
jgi:formylglycine-generating enzyme required for sulfatase activity